VCSLVLRSTAFIILAIGIGVIATSVIGRAPGYGVLSLYIVYCMTMPILPFALRIVIMASLIALFLGALAVFSSVRGGGGGGGVGGGCAAGHCGSCAEDR
jgi:hypothetical protein